MKQLYRPLLTLIIAIAGILSVRAYDFQIDGIYYNIMGNDQVEVTSGDIRYVGNIVIPTTIEFDSTWYSVSSIGESAFWGSDISSISIPETVTNIKDGAFSHSSLISMNIPNSVKEIGYLVFDGCKSLQSVTLSQNVKEIKYGTYKDCISLSAINLPESLSIIEESAFEGCTVLNNLELPISLIKIDNYGFKDCCSLEYIMIPNSVLSIGKEAFKNCAKLKDVKLSEQLSSIPSGLFWNCSSLTSIEIPAMVEKIDGLFAFYGCVNLTEFKVDQANQYYSSLSGILYNKDFSSLLQCPEGREGDIVIPDTVIEIRGDSFVNCFKLNTIFIPKSVIDINDNWGTDNAFVLSSPGYFIVDNDNLNYASIDGALYDKGLTTLIKWPSNNSGGPLPESLISTEPQAFAFCSKLLKVEFPSSFKYLGAFSFYRCSSLQEIVLPASLINIETGALAQCKALSNITINAIEPPLCSSDVFDYRWFEDDEYNCNEYIFNNCDLYVPEVSLEVYSTTYPWSEFVHIDGIWDAGIDGIFDDSTNFKVYSLSGNKILQTQNKKEINSLPSGLYIINGKKVMISR